MNFPLQCAEANNAFVVLSKKQTHFLLGKSLKKIFPNQIIYLVVSGRHFWHICPFVSIHCKCLPVCEKVVPWERKLCREKEICAVRKKVLPWERKLCREKESCAVRKKVLPWHLWATVLNRQLIWFIFVRLNCGLYSLSFRPKLLFICYCLNMFVIVSSSVAA